MVSPLLRQNQRSMGNGAGSRLSTRRGGEFNAFRPGGSHRTRGLRRARHRDRAGVTTSAIRAATAYVGSGRASQEGFVDLAYICRAGAAGLPLGRGRVPSVQGRRPGLVQLTAKYQGRHRCAWHNIGSRGRPSFARTTSPGGGICAWLSASSQPAAPAKMQGVQKTRSRLQQRGLARSMACGHSILRTQTS